MLNPSRDLGPGNTPLRLGIGHLADDEDGGPDDMDIGEAGCKSTTNLMGGDRQY